MSDIKQAAKWMQEGHRVISSDSQRSLPIYMNEESELFYSAITGTRTKFSLQDLLAEDWEIVPEPPSGERGKG